MKRHLPRHNRVDLNSMKVQAFRADAVILATGGMGLIWGRSTMSTNSTGSAAARVYQQGAKLANAEFVQFHPTAMKGHDKNRLMSEACRGEGGRIWVPKQAGDTRRPQDIPENERFYFLEEWYPTYGNTVPRDVASRAIVRVTRTMGLGLGGQTWFISTCRTSRGSSLKTAWAAFSTCTAISQAKTPTPGR